MRLWQKLFLLTMLIVTAAADVTSLLVIQNSHRLSLAREKKAFRRDLCVSDGGACVRCCVFAFTNQRDSAGQDRNRRSLRGVLKGNDA
ncbi:MAG: hypothetical protein QM689_12200 [Oscillospiraceae bacterium]